MFQWQAGVATFSGFDPDGFPIVQCDAAGDDPRTAPFELHHTFGFAALPRDPKVDSNGTPIAGQACNLFWADEGPKTHGFLGYDPRYIGIIPQLKKGGAMVYSAPGSFQVFDGDDGTSTLYVPVPGGKAHVVTTGVDGNGDPYIGIEHADGMSVLMLDKTLTLKNSAGDAYVALNASGIVLNGNTILNGGATIGSPAGALPAAIAPKLVTYLNALEEGIGTALEAVGESTAASGAAAQAAFEATAAARASLMQSIAALKTSIA